MGNITNADNVFSYAASFGATNYEDILSAGILNEVTENIEKLTDISVRDENSKSIIYKLLGKTAEIHLDPVLISNFDVDIKLSPDFKTTEKFLIVYSYTGRISDKREVENIIDFAQKNSLKIYTIFCRYKWADRLIISKTPFQLLKVFQQAEFVVSDTFHGTIFSIITHRRFCTLIRMSNKEKIMSLLEKFNLKEHAVLDPSEMNSKIVSEINYKEIDRIRRNELNKTLEYLNKNLGKINGY